MDFAEEKRNRQWVTSMCVSHAVRSFAAVNNR